MDVKKNITLFKALSEESKYRIIEVLLKGEKCACEIPYLIKRTQSNTSMHLGNLTKLGILKSRREGKMRIYSIKDIRICDVLKAVGHPDGKNLKTTCCMRKKQ